MQRNDIVLVDTNAIIEAHAHQVWTHIASCLHLETVEKCVEETQTGKQKRRPELQIDETLLRHSLKTVHSVTRPQLANFLLNYKEAGGLDAGEKELLAHAVTRTDAWLLCGPDGATVRCLFANKLIDRMVSLEEMLRVSGLRRLPDLEDQYTSKWLSGFRTDLILGRLR